MPTWTSPVRYAEVDQQGVAFNAHYLLWCDEAMNAFCEARGLRAFAEEVRLVTSTLTWRAPACWGDVVEVEARCARIGRTSADLVFELTASGRASCTVSTTYVLIGPDGTPTAIDDATRAALTR